MTWQGAHAQGSNNVGNIGIAVAGHFNDHEPPPQQMEALEALLEHLSITYDIPIWDVRGHRHYCHTDCPGDALLAVIARWRQRQSHLAVDGITMLPPNM